MTHYESNSTSYESNNSTSQKPVWFEDRQATETTINFLNSDTEYGVEIFAVKNGPAAGGAGCVLGSVEENLTASEYFTQIILINLADVKGCFVQEKIADVLWFKTTSWSGRQA